MIDDVLLYVVGLFALAIALGSFIFMSFEFENVSENIEETPEDYADLLTSFNAELPGGMDIAFLALYIAFIITMIAISWYLDTNPLFFVVFIIVIGVCGIIAGYLSNTFYSISHDSFLSAIFSSLPITSYILNNYVIFVIAPLLLMTVVYFAKPQGGGLV